YFDFIFPKEVHISLHCSSCSCPTLVYVHSAPLSFLFQFHSLFIKPTLLLPTSPHILPLFPSTLSSPLKSIQSTNSRQNELVRFIGGGAISCFRVHSIGEERLRLEFLSKTAS
ncbi:hypothetical protein AKJ16_DCAP04275, partial [Drosera capensis]